MAPITIYIFVLSLEPKITYFLWFILRLILRRKIAYVMLTSIPWEYVIFTSIPWEYVMPTSIPWEWWVVGTNLANIEPNRNSHDFNVHVINLLP